MVARYSLSPDPPAGFDHRASYRRRDFRRGPFVLHAPTIEAGLAFLGEERTNLAGVVVAEEPGIPIETHGELYTVRLAEGTLATTVPSLELIASLIKRTLALGDSLTGVSLELERQRGDQARMSREFDTIRTSLFAEVEEHRQTEQRLRDSERMTRAIMDMSFELIAILDLDGHLLDANKTTVEFAGVTLADVLGLPLWETPWWSHSPEQQAWLRAAVTTAATEVEVHFEATQRAASGELHTMDFSLKTITGERGEAVWLMAEAWDITERKRSEQERARLQAQLLQVQKIESIGRLAGGVAHDFNNMLSVIIGHTEFALDAVTSHDPIKDDLEQVLLAAQRSAKLTGQLLAYARKQPRNPLVICLNEAVGGMLAMLRRLIGEENTLVWEPDPQAWPVRIDPSQLDQVVANLVVNARDAITGGGTITITTTNVPASATWERPAMRAKSFVRLSVRDTGQGIAEADMAHIFEPFYTTKGVGRGTGLGLSTVLGIVEQNGGFVDVDSTPGDGTEVRLWFPRAGTSQRVQPTPPGIRRPMGGHETVLLVEDEEIVLKLASRILKILGYEALVANTAARALELWEEAKDKVDLLVTDVVMPGMNGRELALRLREDRPSLKCLFISGYTADQISDSGTLGPGLDFIKKPFTIDQLAQKLRSLLSDADLS